MKTYGNGSFSLMKPNHVALRVPNYEQSKCWFIEKLDFEVVQEWTFGDLFLAYLAPTNSSDFMIELIGEQNVDMMEVVDVILDESFKNLGYHHVCFEVENVDDSLNSLQEKGVKIVGSAFNLDAISKRLGFFCDPWGNLFEVSSDL